MKALILGSTVSGGASSREAVSAAGNGFTVTVVDNATWGAMTAAQFSDFQLIIIGDPTCSTLPAVVSQNAAALADAVMDRGASTNTKVGNRVLIGTDPVFHYSQGGSALIDTAIDFAGVQEGASGLVRELHVQRPRLHREWRPGRPGEAPAAPHAGPAPDCGRRTSRRRAAALCR